MLPNKLLINHMTTFSTVLLTFFAFVHLQSVGKKISVEPYKDVCFQFSCWLKSALTRDIFFWSSSVFSFPHLFVHIHEVKYISQFNSQIRKNYFWKRHNWSPPRVKQLAAAVCWLTGLVVDPKRQYLILRGEGSTIYCTASHVVWPKGRGCKHIYFCCKVDRFNMGSCGTHFSSSLFCLHIGLIFWVTRHSCSEYVPLCVCSHEIVF